MELKKANLDELILEYLDHLEIERNCSRLTVRNYHHYLRRFGNWFKTTTKDQDITKLSQDKVRAYRLYLSAFADSRGKVLSKVTQSYHIIALRSFLKWLVKNDLAVLAPEKIDLPKTESKSLAFLRSDQYNKLLTSISGQSEPELRDKAILEVLFSTGLRVSELARLNRDNIDFKAREFGVIGKGGRARVVFLTDSASQALNTYFEKRLDNWNPAFIRYAKEKVPEDPKGEDMRLGVRSIQRMVEKYRKKASLSVNITPHGLRHTFATDLISHGAGLREVQEMLGHKNIATTQIYTHVTNPRLKQVHKKFHSGNK